jgi:AraC family ethanolamine operon transcriptional activator
MSSPSPAFSPGSSRPAASARPAVAAAPLRLFPDGLVVDIRASGVHEMHAAGGSARYAQLEGGRFCGRITGVHTKDAQLCVEAWSLGVLKRARPPRRTVSFAVAARGTQRLQGRAVTAGAVAVLFDGDELEVRTAGPAEMVSVAMDREALEAHVRAAVGRHLGELRLQGRLTGLRADAGALARVIRESAARAAARPRLPQDAAAARDLELRVVRLLLAGIDAPREIEAPRRGRRLARQAEAWLRENLSEPPSIAVLCDALSASERTLHEAFRTHLGTTPKAYLKVLRLNAAHRDLLRGAPATRVTDVALDWGFEHFGWFSQDYRRMFGEAPSETLHRARARADHRPVLAH